MVETGDKASALLERMLELLLPTELHDAVIGDLSEDYFLRVAVVGRRAARSQYRREAVVVLGHMLGLYVSTLLHFAFRRITMGDRSNVARFFVLNVVAFAIFWVLLFATARIFAGSTGREAVQLAVTVVGALIALRLRARVTALLLSAMVAFNLAELAAHVYWGESAVRGAPTHFAVMGAAVLGVIFGVAITRYQRRDHEHGREVSRSAVHEEAVGVA